MFTTGQEVWCLIYGHGVITEVDNKRFEDTYPVLAKFQNNDDLIISYTANGKFHNQGNITLFPYPVKVVKAITKPSIDWNHVSPEYNYLAQDKNGDGYLCGKNPHRVDVIWSMETPYISATTFTSYVPGTCKWKDSLVERPN